jgi:DNA-binding CsgD family transcriptional regulator
MQRHVVRVPVARSGTAYRTLTTAQPLDRASAQRRAVGWAADSHAADRFSEVPGVGWAALTPREREVVALVTLGATNRQAARALRLSPHTVSTHLRHVFTKLGVCSRVELTRIAVAHQLG